MSPSKKTLGSGITQREHVTYVPGVPLPEGGLRNVIAPPIEEVWEEYRVACQKTLRHFGLPDDLRPVLWLDKEKWEELRPDLRAAVEAVWEHRADNGAWALFNSAEEWKRGTIMSVDNAAKHDEFLLSDSPAGYAARLLFLIEAATRILRELESIVPSGQELRPLRLCELMRTIGGLETEIRIKKVWEPTALVRVGQLSAFIPARDAHNRQRRNARSEEWRKWQNVADKYWKKHPQWGCRAVAKLVKSELGSDASTETIRRRIKRGQG
ncbi:hypothetical protein [Hyphomicrobium sp.]|uniref:hypothetical protein n=1 Tax=Hyphomicrobium sp. TaxID=82 RepID=UPI0025C63461|nr:hypothetical protein [Hyphomicrobium sp.]MCC7253178.1 hypothetical protein [Hyphomicrobium sp.]